MKREELPIVYCFAQSIWGSFKIPLGELEENIFDVTWFSILGNFSIDLILISMQQYALESNYCNVVKIVELCNKNIQIQKGIYINEETILEEIQQAVSYEKCRENYEKLSEFSKEIVMGPHMLARWARIDTFETVVLSNLRKTIKNRLEEKKNNNIIENTKILIDKKQLKFGL